MKEQFSAFVFLQELKEAGKIVFEGGIILNGNGSAHSLFSFQGLG
jgi:hypothetical protein